MIARAKSSNASSHWGHLLARRKDASGTSERGSGNEARHLQGRPHGKGSLDASGWQRRTTFTKQPRAELSIESTGGSCRLSLQIALG